MKTKIGYIFKVLAIIGFIGFGLWALVINLMIINEAVGFWGVVVGFMLAPGLLLAAPWYALVEYSTWFPLMVTYGGGIISFILFGISSMITGE